MKLSDFIRELQELEKQGYGDLTVFYRHGASGDCGELSSAFVDDHIEDTGPFDLKPGEQYISVYAGN